MTALACPVCGTELSVRTTDAVCPNRHAFDRARSGYLNLLLSNKKQSAEAAMTTVAEILAGRRESHVADLGCGEGFF